MHRGTGRSTAATVSLVLPIVVAACIGIGPRQAQWTASSNRLPGLIVVCEGERLITQDECLSWGERVALNLPLGKRASRVEIYTRPPGGRCAFTAYGNDGMLALSATGPCEGRPPPG